MKKLLCNRKTLYLVLSLAVVSVFTLSIAYAALSTVLEIQGNSEIVASSWDIYLENVQVKNGSVSANAPSISGNSTLSFDVDLNLPGDYFEFTVDVVNDGSIDAMIDSVVKIPELTTAQAKYIKYEITYENGESINTKQTLKKSTSTPIKVRVEYRKDIEASDLPSVITELSLKLTLVYVQSDGSGSSIPNNGSKVVTVVSGNGTQMGDEVCIGDECFYVISSDDTSVTMLAKYNLAVGNKIIDFDIENDEAIFDLNYNHTGIQSSDAKGFVFDENNELIFPWGGVIEFSSYNYWSTVSPSGYSYIYNSNSTLYQYVESYKNYLNGFDVGVISARLISYDELILLGCENNRCHKAPSWVYSTSYWTGFVSGNLDDDIYTVDYDGIFGADRGYDVYTLFGVRPVIEIPIDLFRNL